MKIQAFFHVSFALEKFNASLYTKKVRHPNYLYSSAFSFGNVPDVFFEHPDQNSLSDIQKYTIAESRKQSIIFILLDTNYCYLSLS